MKESSFTRIGFSAVTNAVQHRVVHPDPLGRLIGLHTQHRRLIHLVEELKVLNEPTDRLEALVESMRRESRALLSTVEVARNDTKF